MKLIELFRKNINTKKIRRGNTMKILIISKEISMSLKKMEIERIRKN